MESTKAGKLGALLQFNAALAANASDLPHIEGARVRLERALTEAQEISKQQAAFAASKQEASKRLQVLLEEGVRLATAIRKLLGDNYGIRSEKLTEFGVQPFRGRKARKVVVKPEPPAPPAAPLDTNS
jgi:hypothetical protein